MLEHLQGIAGFFPAVCPFLPSRSQIDKFRHCRIFGSVPCDAFLHLLTLSQQFRQAAQFFTKAALVCVARYCRFALWCSCACAMHPRLPLMDFCRLCCSLFRCPVSRCHDLPLIVWLAQFYFLPCAGWVRVIHYSLAGCRG